MIKTKTRPTLHKQAQVLDLASLTQAAAAQRKALTALGAELAQAFYMSEIAVRSGDAPFIVRKRISDYTGNTSSGGSIKGIWAYLQSRPERHIVGGATPVFVCDAELLTKIVTSLSGIQTIPGRLPPVTEGSFTSPCICYCDQPLFVRCGLERAMMGHEAFPEVAIFTLSTFTDASSEIDTLAEGVVLAHELEHAHQMLEGKFAQTQMVAPESGEISETTSRQRTGGFGEGRGPTTLTQLENVKEWDADAAGIIDYLINFEGLSTREAGRVVDALLHSVTYQLPGRGLKHNSYLSLLYRNAGLQEIPDLQMRSDPVAYRESRSPEETDAEEYVDAVASTPEADVLRAREPFMVGGKSLPMLYTFYLPAITPEEAQTQGFFEQAAGGPRELPTQFVIRAGQPAVVGLYENPYGHLHWLRNDAAKQGGEVATLVGRWIDFLVRTVG